MGDIRVAVAGIGNLCSSLLQGVYYYGGVDSVGLLHQYLGGYGVKDIKFVAAFDIAKVKVGKDLSEAIHAPPNKAPRVADVPALGVSVVMGLALDESEPYDLNYVQKAEAEMLNISSELCRSKADILVNMISGGSDMSSKAYAKAAAEAGCAFVNATPSIISRDSKIIEKYNDAVLPLVGDDLLDQVGATVVHIGLLEFLHSRGLRVDESYQLDVGGGTESINTLEKTKETKRSIKTAAVTGAVPYKFPLVSGSTDFVDFLGNGRDSFFWIKGRGFSGIPFTMDVKLSSFDAPNGGSILIDVIRAVKIAKEKKLSGNIIAINEYAFKRSERKSLHDAYVMFRELTG